MNNFARNLVVLTGNLTSDPKEFQAGETMGARATIAVQENKDHTDFIFITAFGAEAQKLLDGAVKGSNVTTVGKITTNTVEKDGKKRTFMNIIADRVSVFDKQAKQRKTEAAQYEEASDKIPF